MVAKNGKWFMLRVTDRQRDREERYLNNLLKKVETFACAEEPHESEDTNYHYHSLHKNKKTTLHERLNALDWKGNENKAFTHLIEDNDDHWRRCLCYISKGPKHGVFPKIVKNDFNYTTEQIWVFHNEWWEKWYKMKFTEVKKAKPSWTKQIILEFEEKFCYNVNELGDLIEPDTVEISYPVEILPSTLYEFVEAKFCGDFKPFKTSLVTDICRTIWLRNRQHFTIHISQNLQREQFVEKMCLQIFSIRSI